MAALEESEAAEEAAALQRAHAHAAEVRRLAAEVARSDPPGAQSIYSRSHRGSTRAWPLRVRHRSDNGGDGYQYRSWEVEVFLTAAGDLVDVFRERRRWRPDKLFFSGDYTGLGDDSIVAALRRLHSRAR